MELRSIRNQDPRGYAPARDVSYTSPEAQKVLRKLLHLTKALGRSVQFVSALWQIPVRRDQYAFATFKRDVYLSRDGAKTWIQIANEGRAQ